MFPEDLADVGIELVDDVESVIQTFDGSGTQCCPGLFTCELGPVEIDSTEKQSGHPPVAESLDGIVEDLSLDGVLHCIPLLGLPGSIDHIPSLGGLGIDDLSGLEIPELVVILGFDPIQKDDLKERVIKRSLACNKLPDQFFSVKRPTT